MIEALPRLTIGKIEEDGAGDDPRDDRPGKRHLGALQKKCLQAAACRHRIETQTPAWIAQEGLP